MHFIGISIPIYVINFSYQKQEHTRCRCSRSLIKHESQTIFNVPECSLVSHGLVLRWFLKCIVKLLRSPCLMNSSWSWNVISYMWDISCLLICWYWEVNDIAAVVLKVMYLFFICVCIILVEQTKRLLISVLRWRVSYLYNHQLFNLRLWQILQTCNFHSQSNHW